jgi:hypothetical protein
MSTVFRGFWHGSGLSPYELLCLKTFVNRGHRFELFTYDEGIAVPEWIVRRDAREILPAQHVLTYQNGIGAGSPALHANLFRYHLLHQLGGWWVDLDVLLLRTDVPDEDEFYASDPRGLVFNGILKFPKESPLLAEAISRCEAVGETAEVWGQTGPQLITELIGAFGRTNRVRAPAAAYPLDHTDMEMVFDPARCDEVEERVNGAWFVHLYNELRRRAGFPREAGPPPGSYLDRLFEQNDVGVNFPYRLRLAELRRWLNNHFDANTYRTLYENSKESSSESVKDSVKSESKGQFQESRMAAIEQQNAAINRLERRLAEITASYEAVRSERDLLLAGQSAWLRATMPFYRLIDLFRRSGASRQARRSDAG